MQPTGYNYTTTETWSSCSARRAGLVVLRFNFRGVGRSQGRYDGGIGGSTASSTGTAGSEGGAVTSGTGGAAGTAGMRNPVSGAT